MILKRKQIFLNYVMWIINKTNKPEKNKYIFYDVVYIYLYI